MNEEKIYEYKGTVTISTEEYRDLITDCIKSKADADDYRRKFWNEQSAKSKVEKERDEALEKIKALLAFINESKERAADYGVFIATRNV